MTTETKKPTISLEPGTGRILRTAPDGSTLHIASFAVNSDTLTYESEDMKRRFQSGVGKLLNANGLKAGKTEVKPGPVLPQPPAQPSVGTVLGEELRQQVQQQNDPYTGLTVAQRKAVLFLRGKEGFPLFEIEPAPAKAPRMGPLGPKNPEYIMHLLRYDPVQFCRQYRVLGIGNITQVVREVVDKPSGQTALVEKPLRCVLSLSKTHLTEKADDLDVEVES